MPNAGSARSSGIIAHVSSLPGRHGIGDLDAPAERFVDFLTRTRQGVWQVLPIGPTGFGHSPYQSPSSFAGNPLFIGLQRLVEDGWLKRRVLKSVDFPPTGAELDRVGAWRRERLLEAAGEFFASATPAQKAELARFRKRHAAWLEDYTLFVALKEHHGGLPWTAWDAKLVHREKGALRAAAVELKPRVEAEAFIQFQFWRQWTALKGYANERGVRIFGDVPIFVAHDSADVWANQGLFHLDRDGHATVVAGVPPDYFSRTGQLWGNPLYRWDVLKKQGYAWWIERLRHAFRLFDLVRIDHFRGFEAYWEVPGDAPTAATGRWVKGPGIDLFRAAEAALGPLPIVAEDLGMITEEVEALRDELGAPGMRVLQFAFGDDAKASDYQPHNYPRHCLAYTGTHDNDTTVGWFQSQAGEGTTRDEEQVERERRHILDYVGTDGREIHWDMIRLAWGSVADTAIAPLQDVLGLGSEARMNLPGTGRGNWAWRFTEEQITPEVEARLHRLTELFERGPARTVAAPRARRRKAKTKGR